MPRYVKQGASATYSVTGDPQQPSRGWQRSGGSYSATGKVRLVEAARGRFPYYLVGTQEAIVRVGAESIFGQGFLEAIGAKGGIGSGEITGIGTEQIAIIGGGHGNFIGLGVFEALTTSARTQEGDIVGSGTLVADGDAALIGITSIEMVASATSNGETITVPATILAGDFLVLGQSATNNIGTPSLVTPSGFETATDTEATGNNGRVVIQWKLADGTEDGATLTGMNGTDIDRKILAVFRADIPITAVVSQDGDGQSTSGNPSAQVKNASADPPPIIVIGFSRASGGTTSISMSPTEDGTISGTSAAMLYKIYLSSPADVTVDQDDDGSSNLLASCYFEVD